MDDKTMYFQIGGHPAFACPCEGGMIRDDYSVRAGESPLLEVAFLENGLLSNEKELHSNEFVLEEDTFARDAFILQNETIGHLEKGQYNPSLKLAMDIAGVFGVKVKDLFEFTDE